MSQVNSSPTSSSSSCWVSQVVCLPGGETLLYGILPSTQPNVTAARRLLIHYYGWKPSLTVLLHPKANIDVVIASLSKLDGFYSLQHDYYSRSSHVEFEATKDTACPFKRKKYKCLIVRFHTLEKRRSGSETIKRGKCLGLPPEPDIPLEDLIKWPFFCRSMPQSPNEPYYYVYETARCAEPERQFWQDCNGFPFCWITWTDNDISGTKESTIQRDQEPDGDTIEELTIKAFKTIPSKNTLPEGMLGMAMDIETRSTDWMRDRFSNPCVDGDAVITIAMSFYRFPNVNTVVEGYVLMLRSPEGIRQPNRQDCIAFEPHPQSSDIFKIEYYNDEVTMIERYFFLRRKASVDLSYNGVQFDVPYLTKRLIQHAAMNNHVIADPLWPYLQHSTYSDEDTSRFTSTVVSPTEVRIRDDQTLATITGHGATPIRAFKKTDLGDEEEDLENAENDEEDDSFRVPQTLPGTKHNRTPSQPLPNAKQKAQRKSSELANRFGFRVWTAGAFSDFVSSYPMAPRPKTTHEEDFGGMIIIDEHGISFHGQNANRPKWRSSLLSLDEWQSMPTYLRTTFVGSLDYRIITPPVRCNMQSSAAGKGNTYFILAVPGQHLIDVMLFLRQRPFSGDFKLLNLKTVAAYVTEQRKDEQTQNFLKMDMDFREMNRLWLLGDYNHTMHYCYRDARILLVLAEHYAALNDVTQLAATTLTDSYAISYRGQGVRVNNTRLKFTKMARVLGTTTQADKMLEQYFRKKQQDLGRKKEKYQGAIVLPPLAQLIIGLIPAVDFGSLYPSIIVALGIDPSTNISSPWFEEELIKMGIRIMVIYIRQKDDRGKKPEPPLANGPYEESMKYVIAHYDIASVEQRDALDVQTMGITTAHGATSYKEYTEPSDVWHRSAFIDIRHYRLQGNKAQTEEFVGVNESMVRHLKVVRTNIRDKQKGLKKTSAEYQSLEAQQLSIKVVMNSMYGALADQRKALAAVVTAFGRMLILMVADYLKKLRYCILVDESLYPTAKSRILDPSSPAYRTDDDEHYPLLVERIIYGDTDSVFPLLNEKIIKDRATAKEVGNHMANMIIKHLDIEYLTMEMERVISFGLWLNPKTYAYHDGHKLTIKALQAKRRGTAGVISQLQRNYLDTLLYVDQNFNTTESLQKVLHERLAQIERQARQWLLRLFQTERPRHQLYPIVENFDKHPLNFPPVPLLEAPPLVVGDSVVLQGDGQECEVVSPTMLAPPNAILSLPPPFALSDFMISMQIAGAYANDCAQTMCNADRERRKKGTGILPGSRLGMVVTYSLASDNIRSSVIANHTLPPRPEPNKTKVPRYNYVRDYDLVEEYNNVYEKGSHSDDFPLPSLGKKLFNIYRSHYLSGAMSAMQKIFAICTPAVADLYSWAENYMHKVEAQQQIFPMGITLSREDGLPLFGNASGARLPPPRAAAKKKAAMRPALLFGGGGGGAFANISTLPGSFTNNRPPAKMGGLPPFAAKKKKGPPPFATQGGVIPATRFGNVANMFGKQPTPLAHTTQPVSLPFGKQQTPVPLPSNEHANKRRAGNPPSFADWTEETFSPGQM